MRFHRHAIMLLCSDVPAARDYYIKHLDLEANADLGWFVGLQRRDHPREAFELSLCAAGHESTPKELQRPTDGLIIAFEVADAQAEHDRLAAAEVPILTAMRDEPWGQRHFFAAAPDGVALDIFQLVPPDPAWMKANGFG